MRYSVQAIAALSLSSGVAGFGIASTALTSSRRIGGGVSDVVSNTRLSISGQGWENDDFLNSLGGSSEDRDKANNDYYRKKEDMQRFRDRQAERDSPMARRFMDQRRMDMDDSIAQNSMDQSSSDNMDNMRSQGGQSGRFRDMMQQSQQRMQEGGQPILNDLSWDDEVPYSTSEPPMRAERPNVVAPSPTPAPPTADKYQGVDFDNLAAQARGGMGGAPMAQTTGGTPPPPRRRDQIANTSDVYLEQLKADTKARKEAFLVGDYDGHQSVWKTPKIQELENYLQKNPYFESEKDRQKRMLEMFEPTEEDLLVMRKQMEEQEAAKNLSKSVSYKDKLAAKKKEKGFNSGRANSSLGTQKQTTKIPDEATKVPQPTLFDGSSKDEFIMKPPTTASAPPIPNTPKQSSDAPLQSGQDQQHVATESLYSQSGDQNVDPLKEQSVTNVDALTQPTRDSSYRLGEPPMGDIPESPTASQSSQNMNINFDQLAQAARSGVYNPEEGVASLDVDRQNVNFDALANSYGRPGAGPPMVQTSGGNPPPPRRRDQIANASDVYLEQLKADTKARKESFLLGDYEGHQSVWKTPKIKELENYLQQNPYFESEKERQKRLLDMFEPTEEDMLVMKKQMEESQVLSASKSVSYKDKLAEKKRKIQSKTQASTSADVTSPVNQVSEPDLAIEQPFVMKSPEALSMQRPAQNVYSTTVDNQSLTETTRNDDENQRRSLRTLMGLILKHRGGPGFGAGFLKGPDIVRFDSTLAEVTAMLKSECGEAATPVVSNSIRGASPVISTEADKNIILDNMRNDEVFDEESAIRSIRTLMGLILKHRGGPGFGAGFLKGPDINRFEQTLADVSATIRSEVIDCDEVTQNPSPPDTVSIPKSTSKPPFELSPLDESFQCIDAIVNMYKQAPSRQRDELLIPLRDALVSVVTKCNSLIDEARSDSVDDNVELVGDIMARVVPSDTSGHEEDSETDVFPLLSVGSTSELFARAKASLESLTGDGKYGLSECSSNEALEAIELLKQVRVALMDELEFGQ